MLLVITVALVTLVARNAILQSEQGQASDRPPGARDLQDRQRLAMERRNPLATA